MEKQITIVKVTSEKGKKFLDRLREMKQENLKDLEAYVNQYLWKTNQKWNSTNHLKQKIQDLFWD